MTIKSCVYLAARMLFGRREGQRGRIRSAIIAVGLSLVPLVVVLQVSDGMIQGITSRFIETGTYHLQAIGREDVSSQQLQELQQRLSLLPGVTATIPERQGIGLLYSDSGRTGATVRAVAPEIWQIDPGFRTYMEVQAGSFDLHGESPIVLGSQIARRLQAAPGDVIRLLTVRPGPGGAFLPRVSSFTVSGIVSTGYQDLDRLWVYIPLQRGLQVLAPGTARQIIGIKIDNPYGIQNPIFSPRPDPATAALVRSIRGELDASWRLFSWYDLERSRYMSFLTTKNLLVFIMALIVCVAAVNISSAMVMLIIEKRPEIAILKSVGATPNMIALVFVLCGFFAGVVGALTGTALGLLASVNVNQILAGIEWLLNLVAEGGGALLAPFGAVEVPQVSLFHSEYYLEQLPVSISLAELIIAASLAIGLSSLAAWIPARRAAAIRPIDVMRKH
ncbi:MAG: ABC transporter permease [Spirochaetaceae bacterium]|nr:MAG: ABC transporter permease [Spirochaetaceae bacterium]